MATTRPDLAAQLVGTDPTTVTAGTNKVLLWRCPNHDEPYPATGAKRLSGSGCGFCANYRVLPGFNDMATTHPHLAIELVGTDPQTINAGTSKMLMWRCPNHEEPYPCSGWHRLSGKGCGYCAGQRVLAGFNDMATTHPTLASELVGTDPTTVTAGSRQMLLWRCPKHEQPYPSAASTRLRGIGCGYCRGSMVLPGFNDMATTDPELAAELENTDPTTVVAGTHSQLTWRCSECQQTWHATGAARRSTGNGPGTGCPSCANYGFDPNMPTYLYLMGRPGEQQVGITRNVQRRQKQHGDDWALLDVIGPVQGSVALRVEVGLKRWLRTIGTLPGTTERWSTARLEVEALNQLLDLAGQNPQELSAH